MTATARPTLQAIARWFIHGVVCCSEICAASSDAADDHAHRTQVIFARDAVRAHRAGEHLEELLHRHLCLGCDRPALHALRMRPLADQLEQRLRDR